MRLAATLTLAGLTGALLPATSAGAQGCGPARLPTFHVHVHAEREVVRAGNAAGLEVSVARHVAHNDVAGAQDANVLVIIEIGRTRVGEGALTDAGGLAPISVDLPRNVGTGLADVTVLAWKEAGPCAEEYGETVARGLFRVRK